MSVKTPSEKPAKVDLALRLLYLALAIGVLQMIMTLISHLEVRSPDFLIYTSLARFAVVLFLIYQTGKGRNWARWSLGGIFVIGIPLAILPAIQSISHNPLYNILELVQFALLIVALVLLFHRSASPWFAEQETEQQS
jgi:hypothetical protein